MDLHTNDKGRLSRVVVTKSTGDQAADDRLKRAAMDNFHNKVAAPKKNAVYHQPAKIYFPPEPLFK